MIIDIEDRQNWHLKSQMRSRRKEYKSNRIAKVQELLPSDDYRFGFDAIEWYHRHFVPATGPTGGSNER